MSGCGCGCAGGAGGPYSKGRELVEFVCQAHGGAMRDQPVMNGPIKTECQGCGQPFELRTYVDSCPACGGVHAVAPMHPTRENIQYAGEDFQVA